MDIDSLLHPIESFGATPLAGRLLVADPLLRDGFFDRTVALLLQRDSRMGYFGLVLNKRTPYTLCDLLPDWDAGRNIRLYSGGPVEPDRLFMLHRLPDVLSDSVEVMNGLFVGGKLDNIVEYVESGNQIDGYVRLFLGYSGWSAGQLEREIARNSWACRTLPEVDTLLKGSGQPYWRREVKRLGPDYRSWLLMPADPSMN